MPGWVAPTVALSLVVIAVAVGILTSLLLVVIKEAKERGQSLAREVSQLRADIAPTLESLKRLGEKGIDVADLAQTEAKEIIETTRRIRYDVERGVKRVKRRLADFEAVVEVAQEEMEATVIGVSTALETMRSGAGMIGQLRRFIRPRRRGGE